MKVEFADNEERKTMHALCDIISTVTDDQVKACHAVLRCALDAEKCRQNAAAATFAVSSRALEQRGDHQKGWRMNWSTFFLVLASFVGCIFSGTALGMFVAWAQTGHHEWVGLFLLTGILVAISAHMAWEGKR